MYASRVALAASAPLSWIADPNHAHVEYASQLTQTKKGTVWREVFKRARQEQDQLLLDGTGAYAYDCIATNDLNIDEKATFIFYNGRAHIENNIRELKYDYHLGKIITDSFDANDAITQVTLMTYLLIQHFKYHVLPTKMKKCQLSTIRTQVFNVPGKYLRAARKLYLKIHNLFRDADFYALLFYRVKYLESWILTPPAFAL